MILVRVNEFDIISLIDESCQIPSTFRGMKSYEYFHYWYLANTCQNSNRLPTNMTSSSEV